MVYDLYFICILYVSVFTSIFSPSFWRKVHIVLFQPKTIACYHALANVHVTYYLEEAQLPLRNRALATYFFIAKLISIAHSCLIVSRALFHLLILTVCKQTTPYTVKQWLSNLIKRGWHTAMELISAVRTVIFTVTMISPFNTRSIVASEFILGAVSRWRSGRSRCLHKANVKYSK